MFVKALITAYEILLGDLQRISEAIDHAIDLTDCTFKLDDMKLFGCVDCTVLGQLSGMQQNGVEVFDFFLKLEYFQFFSIIFIIYLMFSSLFAEGRRQNRFKWWTVWFYIMGWSIKCFPNTGKSNFVLVEYIFDVSPVCFKLNYSSFSISSSSFCVFFFFNLIVLVALFILCLWYYIFLQIKFQFKINSSYRELF